MDEDDSLCGEAFASLWLVAWYESGSEVQLIRLKPVPYHSRSLFRITSNASKKAPVLKL